VDQSVSCSSHFRNTHLEKVAIPEAAAFCIFVTNPVFLLGSRRRCLFFFARANETLVALEGKRKL
jgi:hypothetical protein